MDLVVAAISVFPDLDVVGIAGGIDPAVNGMMAALGISPSMKLMGASVNVQVVEDLVGLSVFDPGSDGLGLASDSGQLRNNRIGVLGFRDFGNFWGGGDFRSFGLLRRGNVLAVRPFSGERGSGLRKRGVLAGNRVAADCCEEESESDEDFHVHDN